MDLTPVILQGNYVRLEPLTNVHLADLVKIGMDPSLWKWTVANVVSPEDMKTYINGALSQQADGTALPFVTMTTVHSVSGAYEIVGSTRFFNIDYTHKRLEIGHTWIAKPWQRTVVNSEAKYLMLQYAFEKLGVNRVEFKTDALNEKSRTAIKRIGAREEGILRKHSITELGRMRDTVYYSILADEWGTVKNTLEKMIQDVSAKR